MKKLYKRTYNQDRSIQGYAVTCKTGCACICAVCTCLGPDFLHVSDRSAKHGHAVKTATRKAQLKK